MEENGTMVVSDRDLNCAIAQLEEYTRPDGAWKTRDVWRVDLGPLASLTVTTRQAAEAAVQLLRDAESWREFLDQIQ